MCTGITTFPFDSLRSSVSSEFKLLIEKGKELGFSSDRLLTVFAQFRSTDDSNQALDHLILGEKKIGRKDAEDLLKRMKQFSPISFLKQYYATNNMVLNLSLENGYLFKRFLEGASNCQSICFIDANPYLVEMAVRDLPQTHQALIFAFHDPRLTRIYRAALGKKTCIVDLEKLSDFHNLEAVMVFAQRQERPDVLHNLDLFSTILENNTTAKISAVFPSRYLSGKEQECSVREEILTRFHLEEVIPIDSRATKQGPKRKTVFTIAAKQDAPKPARIGTAISNGNLVTEIHDVICSRERLETEPGSILDLYKKLKKEKSPTSTRTPHLQLFLCPEIVCNYSMVPYRDDRIRVSYRIYSVPHSNREKRQLLYGLATKVVDDEMQFRRLVEDLPFLKTEFYSKVKSFLSSRGGKDLSLKAFWLFHRQKLYPSSQYQDEFCKNTLFSSAEAPLQEVTFMPMRTMSEEILSQAIASFKNKKQHDFSDEAANNIWRQLYLIFNYGQRIGAFCENPIEDLHKKIDQDQKNYRNARKNLVDKHFQFQEMQKLIKTLLEESNSDCRNIAMLLALFGNLTAAELTALCWKDFRKIKNFPGLNLRVVRYQEEKGRKIQEYLDESRIRMVPIVPDHAALLRQWKNNTEDMIGREVDEEWPIFYREQNPEEPITPSVMRRFFKEKTAKVRPMREEDFRSVALDGGGNRKLKADIYAGNLIDMNFEYYGPRYAALSEGEAEYFRKEIPKATLHSSYISLNSDAAQYAMMIKINRWWSRSKPIEGNNVYIRQMHLKRERTFTIPGSNETQFIEAEIRSVVKNMKDGFTGEGELIIEIDSAEGFDLYIDGLEAD